MAESSVSPGSVSKQTQSIAEDRKRFQNQPGVPAIRMNAEGTILDVTPAGRRLLEYGYNDAMKPCFFSHVHGRNMYQVMRDVADMVCYAKPRASWLLRLKTGRGQWAWFRATVTNRLGQPEDDIRIVLGDLRKS